MKNIPISIIKDIKSKLNKCWNLKIIGADLNKPESLPNAITDPLNVIAPIIEPRANSTLFATGIDRLLFLTIQRANGS